jgi:hypothetical protein
MAVKVSLLVFWVVTSCGHVGRYQCFRGTVSIFTSALKTVSAYKSVQHYNPEDQYRPKKKKKERVASCKTVIFPALILYIYTTHTHTYIRAHI